LGQYRSGGATDAGGGVGSSAARHTRTRPAGTRPANHPRPSSDRCQRLWGAGNGGRVDPSLRTLPTVGRNLATLSRLMGAPATICSPSGLPQGTGVWGADALPGPALIRPLPPAVGLPRAGRGLLLSWGVSCCQNL